MGMITKSYYDDSRSTTKYQILSPTILSELWRVLDRHGEYHNLLRISKRSFVPYLKNKVQYMLADINCR